MKYFFISLKIIFDIHFSFAHIDGMNDVKIFVEKAGGRNAVKDAAKVTYQAVVAWEKNNEIPRDYLPSLEKLARDRKCFAAFKRAAVARGEYSCGGKK